MDQDLSLHGREARNAPVATLCAMFDHAVATAPDKVALRHLDVALTYRELGRAVTALAQRLAPIVTPGEVVALVLPNSIEFHIAYFAALKVLAAPALLNPSYPAVQLSPLLREASPSAVVCAPATRDMVAGLADDLGIPGVVCLGQDIANPGARRPGRGAPPAADRHAHRPRSTVVQRRHHRASQGCRAHARPPRHGGALRGIHVADAYRR